MPDAGAVTPETWPADATDRPRESRATCSFATDNAAPTPGLSPGAKIAILANPFSGAKANQDRVKRLAALLRDAGAEPHAIWDPPACSPALATPESIAHLDALLVAGGDGSIGGAVSHLARALGWDDPDLSPDARPALPPVAMLPLGNENLLARHCGVGTRPEQLVAKLFEEAQAPAFDLGRLSCTAMDSAGKLGAPRRFTCVVSAGLDAEVVRRVAHWRSAAAKPGQLKRVRRRSYVRHVLLAAAQYGYPATRVVADGQDLGEAAQVLVFNVPEYGGGLRFAPEADPTDGRFDYVLLRKPGLLPALSYVGSVVLGRHAKRGDVAVGRAGRIELHPADPQHPAPVEVDGDLAGVAPATIEVEAGRLRLLGARQPNLARA